MRILLALGRSAQHDNVEAAARVLAEIAAEHEVIVTHGNGPQVGHILELALRNELPEGDVVSVLTQVVVTADDPGFRSLVPSPEPHAIAEIRSLRVLLDSGALVICATDSSVPVAIDGLGMMRGVEAVVDSGLTAALLARRLDADLLMMLTDLDSGSIAPKVEALCRFAEATGRRTAIGSLRDVARVVRDEAERQVHPVAS
ncbi:MAG: amino acid kinase family protein [Solirubrobacterales bacterium]